MTNAASEPTTPQPISQPAGTSPTISPARPPARIPSASAAKPQAGTTNISPASSQRDFLHPIPLAYQTAERERAPFGSENFLVRRFPRTVAHGTDDRPLRCGPI